MSETSETLFQLSDPTFQETLMLLGERLSSCRSRGGPSGAEGRRVREAQLPSEGPPPQKVKQDVALPASLVVTVKMLLASLRPTLLTAKMRML